MDDSHKLNAMIMLYKSVNEHPQKDELCDLYEAFYDETIDSSRMENALNPLLENKLIEYDDDSLKISREGLMEGSRQRIEYYFSEGVKKAEMSSVNNHYQDLKNLGAINSDSIMDDEQLSFISDNLKGFENKLYDFGCGRGHITANLQKASGMECIGIDKSESMIAIAAEKYPHMSWQVGEMEESVQKIDSFDAALFIDTLYFVQEKKELITQLYSKLNAKGKLIITYSDYTRDPLKKEILESHKNTLGQVLTEMDVNFQTKEFTENEIALWSYREEKIQSLKDEYKEEKNLFLFYDTFSESKNLLEVLRQGLGRRYIYIIEK